ncbi:hypothetical protein OROHE_009600 [Orobanche hederae]
MLVILILLLTGSIFLSNNSRTEDLTLHLNSVSVIPEPLLRMEHLKHLHLQGVEIKLPSTFKGFNHLVSLTLHGMFNTFEALNIFISKYLVIAEEQELPCLHIVAPKLKKFHFHNGTFGSLILKCPNIKEISLEFDYDDYELIRRLLHGLGSDASKRSLAKVFGQMPSIVHVQLWHGLVLEVQEFLKKRVTFKRVWRVKKPNLSLVAHSGRLSKSWYFDRGCSHHMIGNRRLLINSSHHKAGKVTFGGGEQGNILGYCILNVKGLPKFENVILLDGLQANLLSISHLRDSEHNVKFTIVDCVVYDKNNNQIMEGTCSFDNCYLLMNPEISLKIETENVDLWHQRLAHMHYRGLKS